MLEAFNQVYQGAIQLLAKGLVYSILGILAIIGSALALFGLALLLEWLNPSSTDIIMFLLGIVLANQARILTLLQRKDFK